jgi:hypothetical protein
MTADQYFDAAASAVGVLFPVAPPDKSFGHIDRSLNSQVTMSLRGEWADPNPVRREKWRAAKSGH